MKSEKDILLLFLKAGLSTRALDQQMGFDPLKSKGWKSWKILQKYNIHKNDRGLLFCFREKEVLKIIKKVLGTTSRREVEKILKSSDSPSFFNKYKDIYIVADSDTKVGIVLSGEVRNITRNFFHPLKKSIGKCQFPKCENTNLDTVHLQKSRPENLKSACIYGKISKSNKYDVHKVLLNYIRLHSQKKSLCFLCKKHHEELGSYERVGGKKLVNFRKIIVSNI